MRFLSKEIIELYQKLYPIGCQIKLVHMNDIQAPPPGTFGTVLGIDDAGDILVEWDNGSSLHIIPGIDEFEIIRD